MRRCLLLTLVALVLAVPVAAQARVITPLPANWRKAVNVTAFWWQDLSGPRFETWLKRAKQDLRAQEVTFAVSWFQYFDDPKQKNELQATEIHDSPGTTKDCAHSDGTDWTACKTPSIGALRAAIARAKALGFRVGLRPQVDVGRGTRTSTGRDQIEFKPGPDRDAWFRSYGFFLSQYARLARDTGADYLVIGSDLSGMTQDADEIGRWRSLIADVRSGALMGDGKGGYGGQITYAANWDSLVQDAQDTSSAPFFWDALDYIGIDAYFPLVPGGAPGVPSVSELRTGWSTTFTLPLSPVGIVRALHAKYAKPVMFTALGYLSRTGTAAFPEKSDYDQQQAGGKVSQTVQARAVRAAFDVWGPIAGEGWFDGIDWWEWPASGRGGRGDGSFSLQAKAAETEVCLRHAGVFTARCRPSPQP